MTNSNSNKLSGFPAWMVWPETMQIMRVLNKSSEYHARFVGGCVRDSLVNRKAVEVDIAIDCTPEETMNILRENNIKAIPTGIEHGTVTAVTESGQPFEITSLRKDIKTDGRHAEVEFTKDWAEDSARRDFTVNAIYADMDGNLFDYHNGVEDIRQGRILFVGDAEQRVKEDYLRILRFFRFYALIGKGDADKGALEACKNNAAGLKNISLERITKEVLKMFEADKAAIAWQLMIDSGIINVIMPKATNVAALDMLMKLEEKHENKNSPIRRLASLIENADDAIAHLRLSNAQKDELKMLLRESKSFNEAIDEKGIKNLVYRFGNNNARSILLLSAAMSNLSSDKFSKLYEAATSFIVPSFPMRGDDIIAEGFIEGEIIGIVYKEIEKWWMENDFKPKRSECLARIKLYEKE